MSKKRKTPPKRNSKRAAKAKTPSMPKKLAEHLALMAHGLVDGSIKVGQHKARAKMLAPLLAAMKNSADCYATSWTRDITLNRTDCALLLAVLAEAGYRPGENFDEKREWRLVHMPKAGAPACEANGSDPSAKPMVFERTASEVAKSA